MTYIDIPTWLEIFANLKDFNWEQFLDIKTDEISWDIDQLKLSYWDKIINDKSNKTLS